MHQTPLVHLQPLRLYLKVIVHSAYQYFILFFHYIFVFFVSSQCEGNRKQRQWFYGSFTWEKKEKTQDPYTCETRLDLYIMNTYTFIIVSMSCRIILIDFRCFSRCQWLNLWKRHIHTHSHTYIHCSTKPNQHLFHLFLTKLVSVSGPVPNLAHVLCVSTHSRR